MMLSDLIYGMSTSFASVSMTTATGAGSTMPQTKLAIPLIAPTHTSSNLLRELLQPRRTLIKEAVIRPVRAEALFPCARRPALRGRPPSR